MGIDTNYQLVTRFHQAWQAEDLEQMRTLLSPEVVYESPSRGVHKGVEAVLVQYRLDGRFAHLDGVTMRGCCPFDEYVFIAYDVFYLEEPQRSEAVIDKFCLRDGRIIDIFSVVEAFVR